MDAVKTGGLIAQARREKELTQKDLAELLHVSAQAVSKWENGRSCPDVGLLEPLAEALSLTVTELLSGQRGEEPGEKAVRDSLRFGENQFRPKIRRWKWLFLLTALLLLALLAGLGYVWVRDNTELFPRTVTTVQPVKGTARDSTLAQAAGKIAGYLYQVDFADSVTACSFHWELWTSQGLERSWEAGTQERYGNGRRRLIAVTWATRWDSPDIRYGISLEGEAGVAGLGLEDTLEDIPYMGDALGIDRPTKRAEVDPEEGAVLLVFTLSPDGTFYTADKPRWEKGRLELPPKSGTAKYLLLRMRCE